MAENWTYILGHVLCVLALMAGAVYVFIPRPVVLERQRRIRHIAGANMMLWAMAYVFSILIHVMMAAGTAPAALLQCVQVIVDLLMIPGVVCMLMAQFGYRSNLTLIYTVQALPAILIGAGCVWMHDERLMQVMLYYWTGILVFSMILYVCLEVAYRRYHEDIKDTERRELCRAHKLLTVLLVYFVMYAVGEYVDLDWMRSVASVAGVLVWVAVIVYEENLVAEIDFWRVDREEVLQNQVPMQPTEQSAAQSTGAEEVAQMNEIDEEDAGKLSWIGVLLERQFIETGLYRHPGLNIETVAKEMNTNRTYLAQYFSSKGTTYYSYLNAHRIAYACMLIDGGETNHKLLMKACGYTSDSTYRRAFQEQVGCLPSEYVKRRKK